MLNSERLPQTKQVSWGLSLTTSHSAHRTAFCSTTALRNRPRSGARSISEPFITEPHGTSNSLVQRQPFALHSRTVSRIVFSRTQHLGLGQHHWRNIFALYSLHRLALFALGRNIRMAERSLFRTRISSVSNNFKGCRETAKHWKIRASRRDRG